MEVIKNNLGEMSLEYWCNMEYKRINKLLGLIETEFNTDMNNHIKLKNEILNISNFVKRLPSTIEK